MEQIFAAEKALRNLIHKRLEWIRFKKSKGYEASAIYRAETNDLLEIHDALAQGIEAEVHINRLREGATIRLCGPPRPISEVIAWSKRLNAFIEQYRIRRFKL